MRSFCVCVLLHADESSIILDDGITHSQMPTHTHESWQIDPRDLKYFTRIGIGNVGEVYKGMYRGRMVAIKKLLGEFLDEFL